MRTLRNIGLALAIVAGTLPAASQDNPDTSYWSHSGRVGLTLSQVGFSNWAAGGDPSVSFNGILNYGFKYEKEPHLWQTTLDAGYGTQRIGKSDEDFKKTDDNFILVSRYGYKIANKWYVSALGDFRTQMFKGYRYEEDSAIYVSEFMSPAYSKVGLGITYNHNFSDDESFSATFSPVNGKTTFVLDESLRESYGVDSAKSTKFQGGMDLMLAFKKELVKNVTLSTTFSVFTPYSDMAVAYVNWDMAIWFKINEFFSANITTQMIYNQDVTIVDEDGHSYNSAVQFKEVLGIGLTYSF